ncbi:amino-acid permease inda1 [Rhizodiscina lignyota]|uniref:Amino-acid permease inda1 n=1 Tax=Rhizodiscina lignyota TaxID=1504668 RepID=A0A9P4MBA2_9PEZI|nr:amino-acid permease inda1 [Rhizodiscina lignyota]
MAETPQIKDEKKIGDVPESVEINLEAGVAMEAGNVVDEGILVKTNPLARGLKSRHMQMIAVGAFIHLPIHVSLTDEKFCVEGGAIGAGFFVGSGSALSNGGPGGLVLGFAVIGSLLLCTVQALGEMAVLYPVNGAFYTYVVRFVDPSLGFAVGWEYAIGWLTILPFEISAFALTIEFWRDDINIGVWVMMFTVLIIVIQVFGVRGFGEVEFVLSIIKVVGLVGFIILGIVIDTGGTGPQGYLGAKYWHHPGAFRNGFKGFCAVLTFAAFEYGGTEMVGLAAAEAKNPLKSLPLATKQVLWRMVFFYVVSLFMVTLLVPSSDPDLLNASGANSKFSPFVIAIKLAGIKALPSIFNAVIVISTLSVANSSLYASTRTMQALAERGMGPKFVAYVDSKGRPLVAIAIQLAFGMLGFVGESGNATTIFYWIIALGGLSNFFAWGAINFAHIRFRSAWKAQGHSLDELPFKAMFGVIGSYYGFFVNVLGMATTFYTALFPLGGSPDAIDFFQSYLAAPIFIALYLFWKIYSREWKMFVPLTEMDITSGRRALILDPSQMPPPKTWANLPIRIVRALV